ncbi:polyprenyl synthetase family protein [Thermosediminibacter litoriperuensis]|uniref:Farnesyl diphosphate synthase n=1 Tax=Thermosediminibacter litoriperuensis TaxID=291989 RepID=A0A5S5ALF1_9FIRM|nr:farnesyl diphosphate synthase [Thermosediminibacter litoriperuensis]TYP51642.1 farnesyl-diphosphate synthase [Thermosediminibacter litoriperuensis]
MKNFEIELKETGKIIEKALDFYLPKSDEYPQKIHEAMRYSTFNGGKRIRPVLTMKAAELFGLQGDKVIPTACGIEMIHTYSLVHDDLPIMDNDDLRRGKPTCHKVFGDAIALLAGDALLTHAFNTIAKNARIEGISLQAVIDVIDRISRAAGSLGMIGGQTVDILSQGVTIDEKTLFYMDYHKTGCLIQASLWAGARLAEAPAPDLNKLDRLGEKIGLIFQIVDDLLDIQGDEKKLGKPVGSDVRNKKSTFPSVYGYENSLKLVKNLSEEAKDIIHEFKNGEFFVQLVEFLVERQY